MKLFLYPPGQLGLALHKTILKHKKELGAGPAEKKLEWIKKVALEVIDLLEVRVNSFNKENEENRLTGKEIATVLSTSLNLVIKAIKRQK